MISIAPQGLLLILKETVLVNKISPIRENNFRTVKAIVNRVSTKNFRKLSLHSVEKILRCKPWKLRKLLSKSGFLQVEKLNTLELIIIQCN